MKKIKELQSLLDKKTLENELIKEAVKYGRAKKWIENVPLITWGSNLRQPWPPGAACAVARHSQASR